MLTPQAQRLLEAYDAYCAQVEAFSRARFDEYFGFFPSLAEEETP